MPKRLQQCDSFIQRMAIFPDKLLGITISNSLIHCNRLRELKLQKKKKNKRKQTSIELP